MILLKIRSEIQSSCELTTTKMKRLLLIVRAKYVSFFLQCSKYIEIEGPCLKIVFELLNQPLL